MSKKFIATAGIALIVAACGDDRTENVTGEIMTTGMGTTTGEMTTTDEPPDSTGEVKLDTVMETTGGPTINNCTGDSDCTLIDILFVIDNSGTMGEEQLNLAANFPLLIEQLQQLTDAEGMTLNADVNLMVTTSDFGHPLCTQFQQEGYTPAQGKPIFTGCNERLDWFTGVDPFNPLEIPEACTDNCPQDVTPGGDPFIHFDAGGTNVTFNDITGALSCLAPMGISGCGYEAPLESMLQALRPDACWNDPSVEGCDGHPLWNWVNRGFLREGSILGIAIITDEADCSVMAPDGYQFFTDSDNKKYWRTHPDIGSKQPSSAICWSAGVKCDDDDGDGIKESCTSREHGEVLHPTSRYIEFLNYVEQEFDHDIVMLGVLGVPPVTEHSDTPPYEPIAGGVHDLVYREWKDGEYDGTPAGGDILPAEWADGVTAEHKTWEFGIGPGCTAQREDGTFFGQAIPPVRIREVCESRNRTLAGGEEQIRCCIESICSEDFSPAIQCLTGIIEDVAQPEG